MIDPWGYHLMIDARNCKRELMTDRANVDKFARDLVKRIDMKAFGEPVIEQFGSGNKFGFTLFQLIETSNICAHMCDDSGNIYLDVFSCKDFEQSTVEQCFYEYFEPTRMKVKKVERDADQDDE